MEEGKQMSPGSEELLNTVLALPESERLEIAEALAASLQPTDRAPLGEAWRAVIQRRSQELKEGTVAGVPWDEVKRRAREKAGG